MARRQATASPMKAWRRRLARSPEVIESRVLEEEDDPGLQGLLLERAVVVPHVGHRQPSALSEAQVDARREACRSPRLGARIGLAAEERAQVVVETGSGAAPELHASHEAREARGAEVAAH